MVVVSHLFFFLGDKFRGRCDSCESHLPLCGTIYFPTAPISILFLVPQAYHLFPLPFPNAETALAVFYL